MSTPWLPNGGLKDGTMLMGPYANKDTQYEGPVVEIEYNGVTYYVRHTGKILTEEQRKQIHEYAIERLKKMGK